MLHCKRKIHVATILDLLCMPVVLSLACAETVALENLISGTMFMATRLIAGL